jgi:hypothetical protein
MNKRLEERFIITSERKDMCTVRSLALANYLCASGFPIQKVIDSDKNPQFKVFLFEDSRQIHNKITEYLQNKEV